MPEQQQTIVVLIDDGWVQCLFKAEPNPDFLRLNDGYLGWGLYSFDDGYWADPVLRWQNTGANYVPAGSTFNDGCNIVVVADAWSNPNPLCLHGANIRALDYKSCPALNTLGISAGGDGTNRYGYFRSGADMPFRAASVLWDTSGEGVWTAGSQHTSPELKTIFDDLFSARMVGEDDWIGIVFHSTAIKAGSPPPASRLLRPYDDTPAQAALLTLNFTPPAPTGNPWYARRLMED